MKHGWKLYCHNVFQEALLLLVEKVERSMKRDPVNYKKTSDFGLLERVSNLIYDHIPQNPNEREYYLNNQLKKLRRAKPKPRYRLFFNFFSTKKSIYYLWLNDTDSLRKAGAKRDVYKALTKNLNIGGLGYYDIDEKSEPLAPRTLC